MSIFSVPLKITSTALIVLSLTNCASVKNMGSLGDSRTQYTPPIVENANASHKTGKKKKAFFSKLFNKEDKQRTNRSSHFTGKKAKRHPAPKTTTGQADQGNLDPIARAALWGTRYNHDPENIKNIVRFSQSLRQIGSAAESLTVMRKAARRYDRQPDIQLEFGKSLLANDRAFEAIRYLEEAVNIGKMHDWRAYSAYGIALDQTGVHDLAQKQYDIALALSPNNPTILNNKGLSLALTGNVSKAEQTLRQAVIKPGASPHMRQNLALVLAIQGNIDAAVRLAKSDLAPPLANNNIAFYRNMVANPAYWSNFDAKVNDLPTFDSVPPAAQTPEKVRIKIISSREDMQKEKISQAHQKHSTAPQNVRPESVQSQNVRPKSAQPQNVRPKSAQPQNVRPKSAQPQNVRPKSAQPQNIRLRSTQPQNIRPKSTQPQNVRLKSTQPQNVRPKSMRFKSAQPQNMRPKSTQPVTTGIPGKAVIRPETDEQGETAIIIRY